MSRRSALEVHGISLIRLVFRCCFMVWFKILFGWTFQSYILSWVIIGSSCESKLNYFQLLVLHLHIFYFQRYHEMQKLGTFVRDFGTHQETIQLPGTCAYLHFLWMKLVLENINHDLETYKCEQKFHMWARELTLIQGAFSITCFRFIFNCHISCVNHE